MVDDGVALDPVDVEIGGRIRLRRKVLGVTQAELADHLGVSFQQVQKYERGVNRISASMLLRAAEKLQCSAASLLGEEDADRAAGGDVVDVLREPMAFEMATAFKALTGLKERRAVLGMARALGADA